MVGKREYRRWAYEDETEMSLEEQLTLEDHDYHNQEHGSETPTSTTTFSQPNVTMTASRSHQRKHSRNNTSIKERTQLCCLTAIVLVIGFIAGFTIGSHDRRNAIETEASSSSQPKVSYQSHPQQQEQGDFHEHASSSIPSTWFTSASHEINEPSFHKLFSQISSENIRHNLKRMSQEEHTAGTQEGKSMATAIRDLWRSYGLSVRVEQHKAFLTIATRYNFAEALDNRNGSVIFTTSQIGDDVNLPNARPLIAFSPAANLNGTLIYGHYGRLEDLEFLRRSKIATNGSIALIRFGWLHPSKVGATAAAFGIKGILFYPDPNDFGPLLPATAIRRGSLLTLAKMHEYQKHKSRHIIPAHTISFEDAEQLLRLMRQGNDVKKAPKTWHGGLRTLYSLGPETHLQQTHNQSHQNNNPQQLQIRLRLFNDLRSTGIYNVVAAIPGAWESDRYVIIGCSHDSWTYGAGDPGVGLALLTEIVRSFSETVQKGWKPRRSILFVSWDANLFASSGVSHWLQEHHFEISTRAIAYIDLTRALRGNQTLFVHSSPLLREVVRKAIARVKHDDLSSSSEDSSSMNADEFPSIRYSSSFVTSDEPSFAFFGNLGIPFVRLCMSNSPKSYDYPLFHTAFDTFENFVRLVDPSLKGTETLGRIITEMIVLLADSSVLPINVEDYVVEIQKAFGSFMAHYQEDLHKANLSIAYLQAAVMRLEVIGDNFRTEMHNRSVITPDHEILPPPPPVINSHLAKTKKTLLHRIINDKLMEIDRTFLSRSSDMYKHQVLGYSTSSQIPFPENDQNSSSFEHYFPKLRDALRCATKQSNFKDRKGRDFITDSSGEWNEQPIVCRDWRSTVSQRIASLTRALDAASAVLQSPLLPEESE